MAEKDVSESVRLTNNDFRKMLMTPRVPNPSSAPESEINKNSNENSTPSTSKKYLTDRGEKRRNKKKVYAKIKKEEEARLAELSSKYRDRAKERRERNRGDKDSEEHELEKISENMTERETKYLGGDQEHTHLVKGLDFILCRQVKEEIERQEKQKEEELENLVNINEKEEAVQDKKKDTKKKETELKFRTSIGRNIFQQLVTMKSKKIEQNEYFAAGRMTYLFEHEDENTFDDIPTTRIKSKADMPTVTGISMLRTNDIVINKLTQILYYLRQGAKHGKKNKKKDREDEPTEVIEVKQKKDFSIYDDIGEYSPSTEKRDSNIKSKKIGSYFMKPQEADKGVEITQNPSILPIAISDQSLGEYPVIEAPKPLKLRSLNKFMDKAEGYSECYPEMEEMHDALHDSDEEVDYSKMDTGRRRKPISRWDFETEDEYTNYLGGEEALPKAVYQFGVKMADGRSTNKFGKPKNEKTKLDREWQQIQSLMSKRKSTSQAAELKISKVPKY